MPNSCPVGPSCLRLSNRHIASGALARARPPPAGLVEPGALSVRTRASGRRTQECRQRGHRRLRGRPSYCADLRAPCQEKHELLSTQGLVRQLPECPGPAIRMVWLAAEFISPLKWADRHKHTHTHTGGPEKPWQNPAAPSPWCPGLICSQPGLCTNQGSQWRPQAFLPPLSTFQLMRWCPA